MRFSWLILLFYCTYLFLVLLKIEQVVFYMKPFLIPSLLLLLVGDLSLSENKPLLFALFFSTLGDILLMFKGESFFILGLISFLLAHLVYILIFKGLLKPFKLNGFVVLTTAFIVTYFMVFVSYLWPFLGEMRLPLLLYLQCSGFQYNSIKTELAINGISYLEPCSSLSLTAFYLFSFFVGRLHTRIFM